MPLLLKKTMGAPTSRSNALKKKKKKNGKKKKRLKTYFYFE
jgi:hypothetical protein